MWAHLEGKQCQRRIDDISLTGRQLRTWAWTEVWRSECKTFDLSVSVDLSSEVTFLCQRWRERKHFLKNKNASCLKSSRALQHAAGLQHADLHLITWTSLPSWGPTGCWLGRFPRSGGGPRSCGEVMRWCVQCPLLLMRVSWRTVGG